MCVLGSVLSEWPALPADDLHPTCILIVALVIVYMYTFFIKKILFLVGSSFKKSCNNMPNYAKCHPIFALALPSLVTSRPTHSRGGSETTSPTYTKYRVFTITISSKTKKVFIQRIL